MASVLLFSGPSIELPSPPVTPSNGRKRLSSKTLGSFTSSGPAELVATATATCYFVHIF